MAPFPPGSYLAAPHATADLDPSAMATHVSAAAELGLPFVPRTYAQVRSPFEGLELAPPGLVPVQRWRPPWIAPHTVYSYAGVARKP